MKNEGQKVEFKENWKDDALKTVCAFANTKGGILYIGVNDKGKAIGLQNIRKLLEAGLIESWGRGTLKVINAFKKKKLPSPSFVDEQGGFSVIFKKGNAIGDLKGSEVSTTTKTVSKTVLKTASKTTQEKIINLLKEKPLLTRKQLSEEIGVSLDGIKYHMSRLKKAGKIKYCGSARKGYWKIKG